MICLPTRFLERGLRLPLVGTLLLLRGWTNGARGPCWLRPPPTFPSPAFFYFPLEEGPALSWGRARAGLPPLCTAPREVGSPVRLVPLLRAPSPSCLCTARGNGAGCAGCLLHLFIYPPPAPSQCVFYVLITLSTRRTCARARAASLALPPPPLPPPPPISNWPLGPFQKVNAPHRTPSHHEGPPHPNPHPIQTLVQKHFGIAERSFLATKQVLGLEIFQEGNCLDNRERELWCR